MSVFSNLTPESGIGDILVADPARFGPVGGFTQDLMRGDGALTATAPICPPRSNLSFILRKNSPLIPQK